MWERVTTRLDKIADRLEAKGFKKEAMELDMISNTMELEAKELTHEKRESLPSSSFVFPADSTAVKDDKDHFPIHDKSHARNALARANQYSKSPSWYTGSLDSLKKRVAEKVKSKFPSIEVSEESTD